MPLIDSQNPRYFQTGIVNIASLTSVKKKNPLIVNVSDLTAERISVGHAAVPVSSMPSLLRLCWLPKHIACNRHLCGPWFLEMGIDRRASA